MRLHFLFFLTSLLTLFPGRGFLCAQVYVELSVENQQVSGNSISFDVFLTRTGSNDLYLGSSDFVLTFDTSNFSNPLFEKVANPGPYLGSSAYQNGYCNFVSTTNTMSGDPQTIAQVQKRYYDATSVELQGNELIINLSFIEFSNQTEFESRVARIDNNTQTHRLGRFRVTGISNPLGTMNLLWKTSEDIFTDVYSHTTTNPWPVESANISTSDPANSPLPVELIEFTASKTSEGVMLNWKTATEINNLGFHIQRSEDGSNWEVIGFVSGNGTSLNVHSYSFLDEESSLVEATKLYYRLLQEDFNGEESISPIRVVEQERKEYLTALNFYPNPASNGFTFEGIENYNLKAITATSTSGKTISLFENGNRINCENLENGFYIITIIAAEAVITSKIFISN